MLPVQAWEDKAEGRPRVKKLLLLSPRCSKPDLSYWSLLPPSSFIPPHLQPKLCAVLRQGAAAVRNSCILGPAGCFTLKAEEKTPVPPGFHAVAQHEESVRDLLLKC